MVDHEIDRSMFELRYRNDTGGAPAYDPAMLLKIVLYAYACGVISSWRIAKSCRDNIVFMALAAGAQPHFTTIAHFVSSMHQEIKQVFVDVLSACEAQEQPLLAPMISATRQAFPAIGGPEDIFNQAKLTVDAGFHTEANMKLLFDHGIDGYVPDNRFRQRDPRFANAARHKPARAKPTPPRKFGPHDFVYDPDQQSCTYPAGKRLYLKNQHFEVRAYPAVSFQAKLTDCRACELRGQCLQRADQSSSRQVYFFTGRRTDAPETFTAKMNRKIDTWTGRLIYGMRLGIVEPVFGNLKNNIGLLRFTLRGKTKVNIQWNLYCIVHNIGKLYRYGAGFT